MTLTPYDIATLRASVRWRNYNRTLTQITPPCIMYAEGHWELYVRGHLFATSPTAAPLLVAIERASHDEHYLDMLFDPNVSPEDAAIADPKERAEWRKRAANEREAFARSQRALAEQAERRANAFDVSAMSLDSLLSLKEPGA